MNIHNVLISMSISINNVSVCITYVINFHIKYLITTAPSVPMEGAVASAFLASQADTEAALASGSSQAGAENMPPAGRIKS